MTDLTYQLLEESRIEIKYPAKDWREAVQAGIGCLVAERRATWDYYDAILRSVALNGPYFILMPGVALPHARPENGVLEAGFSLVTLAEPVNFGSPENDPISVLLSFCAPTAADQVEHTLAQAVTLFEEENIVEKLMAVNSPAEMEAVLYAVKEDID